MPGDFTLPAFVYASAPESRRLSREPRALGFCAAPCKPADRTASVIERGARAGAVRRRACGTGPVFGAGELLRACSLSVKV